jgi:redox-sensitive bicupin YhaK (pirin superfamily)
MKTILRRDQLRLGGFAGLKEHRLVTDSSIFGPHKEPDTFDGIGSFVYLADARFNPHGETRMHPHREIDVISVMVEGDIDHEGTLEHGVTIKEGEVQVQRAGGEGFMHNEINPADTTNRMIQLWFKPEKSGMKADYDVFDTKDQKVTRVYGGDATSRFPGHTIMEVVRLKKGDLHYQQGNFQAYILQGELYYDDEIIQEGDLIEDFDLDVEAMDDAYFIVIYEVA